MTFDYSLQQDSYKYHLGDSLLLGREATGLGTARIRSAFVQLDSVLVVSLRKPRAGCPARSSWRVRAIG